KELHGVAGSTHGLVGIDNGNAELANLVEDRQAVGRNAAKIVVHVGNEYKIELAAPGFRSPFGNGHYTAEDADEVFVVAQGRDVLAEVLANHRQIVIELLLPLRLQGRTALVLLQRLSPRSGLPEIVHFRLAVHEGLGELVVEILQKERAAKPFFGKVDNVVAVE